MQSIDITGVILAGGQAKRYGGQDKGLVVFGDSSLVNQVVDRFSQQVKHILISANRNIDAYRELGYDVLEDEMSDFAGPLAGLLAAMKRAGHETGSIDSIVVVPCDAPLLPKDLVTRLIEAAGSSSNIGSKPLAVIPHDGIRLQPLFGLYSLEALGSLEEFLKSGQRKVGIWVESLSPQVVDFSDQADAFLNINSPEELVEAEKKI